MKNEDFYKVAAKKVAAKKRFFYHLLTYAAIVGMLYTIMQFENNGEILPVIIVGLTWGIGLGIHYLKTFGTEHLDFLGFESNWEEEELKKEVEKLERSRDLRERLSREQQLLADAEKKTDAEPLILKEIVKRPLKNDKE